MAASPPALSPAAAGIAAGQKHAAEIAAAAAAVNSAQLNPAAAGIAAGQKHAAEVAAAQSVAAAVASGVIKTPQPPAYNTIG